MLPGLMQDRPLRIIDIIAFAATAHGTQEIVSKNVDEPITRSTYAGTFGRVAQAAHMLEWLGLNAGDRISTLAWNTNRHFDLL